MKGLAVSMTPVLNSSNQSPPAAVPPVSSLEAATSAPVRSARDSMKRTPFSPAATSQP